MPQPKPPPLPRSLQKNVRQAQAQRQRIIQQKQEAINQDAEAQNNQAQLVKKYEEGTINENEFKQLFGSSFEKYGENKEKALEFAYGKYYQTTSKNPDPQTLSSIAALTAKLPAQIKQELGGSLTSYNSYTTGPIQAQTGSILPEKMPAFIGGEAVVGGYTSTSGQTVFITSSGKQVTQTPASFEPIPASFQEKNFTQYAPTGSFNQQQVQALTVNEADKQRFSNFKKEIPGAITPVSKINLTQRKSITDSFVDDTRSTLSDQSSVELYIPKPKITVEKVSKKIDEAAGYIGQLAGERGLSIESDYYRNVTSSKESIEGLYISTYFTRPSKEKRPTIEEFTKSLKEKKEYLESEEAKIAYGETGAKIAITGQYLLPIIGEAKIGLNLASDIEKGDYAGAGATIITGGILKGGEYVIGKTLFKAGEELSTARRVPTGSGFKNIKTERFITKAEGETLELGLKTVQTVKSSINFAGKTIGAGIIAYEIGLPGMQANQGVSREEIRAGSVESGKTLGYFKAGYEIPSGVYSALKPIIYPLTTRYQLIPVSSLEASDVSKGLTNFPKDVLPARQYLNKVLNKSQTVQGREQAKYFDYRVFNEQVFGFNVSAGQKPVRYYPIKGNSEFVFAEYYNPFNPSFYFGIGKTESGLSGYRIGSSLPETFGEPQFNVLYARGARIINVGSNRGDILFRKGERGVFLIPAQGASRTKSESEALVTGKIIRIGKRYYTKEETLSSKSGRPFGTIFESTEYKVSSSQARFPNPKTVDAELALLEGRVKNVQPFSKPTTQAELEAQNIISSNRSQYYNKKAINLVPSSSSGFKSSKEIVLSSESRIKEGSISLNYYREPSVSYRKDSTTYRPPGASYRPSGYSTSKISYSYKPPPSSSTTSSSQSSIGRDDSSSRKRDYYRPPSLPLYNPPRKPPNQTSSRTSLQSPLSYSRGFKVQTRTRGKIVDLPGVFTRSDALAIGFNTIANTLRASARIVPVNAQARPIGVKAPNVSVRQGKGGFFVQNIGTRLGSIGERTEIQKARKKKGFLV